MIARAVRHCTELDSVPLILQLSNIESKEHVAMLNTRVISIDEVKMCLLARSANSPGISTLICNLLTSVNDAESIEFSMESDCDQAQLWKAAYQHGQSHEIYRVSLHNWPDTQRLPFHGALEHLYAEYQVLMIAVERGKLVLNPVDCVLTNQDTVLVAAKSSQVTMPRHKILACAYVSLLRFSLCTIATRF